jgi:pilus assembly protein CpaE
MVVVVASQDVSALRSAGRLAHALRNRYGKPRVRAVISRLDRHAEIAHADVERVIGDVVSHEVPSDYRAAVEALNAGRPLVLGDGRLAESLRALAASLGGTSKPTSPRPAGVLGRLVFRKA